MAHWIPPTGHYPDRLLDNVALEAKLYPNGPPLLRFGTSSIHGASAPAQVLSESVDPPHGSFDQLAAMTDDTGIDPAAYPFLRPFYYSI